MNKKFKYISAILSAGLLVNPISNLINKNNSIAFANNYSNIKIGEKLYLDKQEQYVVLNKNDYIITEYLINQNKVYNVIIKNKQNLTKEENEKYLNLAKKDIEKLPQDRAVPVTAVITIASAVATIIGTTIAVDAIYYKPDRDEVYKAQSVKNGWVSISKDNKTMWFYKENGNFKKGWHWDSYYKGWYYFYDIKFQFLFKSDVYATIMYNPKFEKSKWLKINNKWYEFESGGKLKQYSGWRKYNNKWLYHLPGDYGAVSNQGLYINGKWYNFDYNGYLI